jgi:hypothetical protein
MRTVESIELGEFYLERKQKKLERIHRRILSGNTRILT